MASASPFMQPGIVRIVRKKCGHAAVTLLNALIAKSYGHSYTWAANSTLADDLGHDSSRAVRRTLARLELAGLVRRLKIDRKCVSVPRDVRFVFLPILADGRIETSDSILDEVQFGGKEKRKGRSIKVAELIPLDGSIQEGRDDPSDQGGQVNPPDSKSGGSRMVAQEGQSDPPIIRGFLRNKSCMAPSGTMPPQDDDPGDTDALRVLPSPPPPKSAKSDPPGRVVVAHWIESYRQHFGRSWTGKSDLAALGKRTRALVEQEGNSLKVVLAAIDLFMSDIVRAGKSELGPTVFLKQCGRWIARADKDDRSQRRREERLSEQRDAEQREQARRTEASQDACSPEDLDKARHALARERLRQQRREKPKESECRTQTGAVQ